MTKAHSKGLAMKRIPSHQGEIIHREGALVPAVAILESRWRGEIRDWNPKYKQVISVDVPYLLVYRL